MVTEAASWAQSIVRAFELGSCALELRSIDATEPEVGTLSTTRLVPAGIPVATAATEVRRRRPELGPRDHRRQTGGLPEPADVRDEDP